MKTIIIYEKSDLDKFGENTPEYYSDYGSHFLQRYKIEIKPSEFYKPEHQLMLGYLVKRLTEGDLQLLRDKFDNKLNELLDEEKNLNIKLQDCKNNQIFYKKNLSKIKECSTFKQAFDILSK